MKPNDIILQIINKSTSLQDFRDIKKEKNLMAKYDGKELSAVMINYLSELEHKSSDAFDVMFDSRVRARLKKYNQNEELYYAV